MVLLHQLHVLASAGLRHAWGVQNLGSFIAQARGLSLLAPTFRPTLSLLSTNLSGSCVNSVAPTLVKEELIKSYPFSSPIGSIRGFKLQPKRTKFRKYFKSICFNDNIKKNTTYLKYGLYGAVAMSGQRIKAASLESMRRAVRRKIGKKGRLIMRIFPHFPVTKKPPETRMGKGKGNVEYYAGCIRPGSVIFELDNVTKKQALTAVMNAEHCIRTKVKFVEFN